MDLDSAIKMKWRTGRRVQRHIYATVENTPTDEDHNYYICTAPTGQIAQHIVDMHNLVLTLGVKSDT